MRQEAAPCLSTGMAADRAWQPRHTDRETTAGDIARFCHRDTSIQPPTHCQLKHNSAGDNGTHSTLEEQPRLQLTIAADVKSRSHKTKCSWQCRCTTKLNRCSVLGARRHIAAGAAAGVMQAATSVLLTHRATCRFQAQKPCNTSVTQSADTHMLCCGGHVTAAHPTRQLRGQTVLYCLPAAGITQFSLSRNKPIGSAWRPAGAAAAAYGAAG